MLTHSPERSYHLQISCKLTRGCFSQLLSKREPCAVLHLFKQPYNVVLLLLFCRRVSIVLFPLVVRQLRTSVPDPSVRLSARRALASNRMYCVRSCVRMVNVPRFEGSERRERYVISAPSADGATGRLSCAEDKIHVSGID